MTPADRLLPWIAMIAAMRWPTRAYPDRKFFPLGKYLPAELLADMKAPRQ
jgi:hypothetical protein